MNTNKKQTKEAPTSLSKSFSDKTHEVAKVDPRRANRWNELVKSNRFNEETALRSTEMTEEYIEQIELKSMQEAAQIKPLRIKTIAKYRGGGKAVMLIFHAIHKHLKYLKVSSERKLPRQHMLEISKLILDEYPHIPLEVICLAIKQGVMGKYGSGKVYNRIDLNLISNWINHAWWEWCYYIERRHKQKTYEANRNPTQDEINEKKEHLSPDLIEKMRETREKIENKTNNPESNKKITLQQKLYKTISDNYKEPEKEYKKTMDEVEAECTEALKDVKDMGEDEKERIRDMSKPYFIRKRISRIKEGGGR